MKKVKAPKEKKSGGLMSWLGFGDKPKKESNQSSSEEEELNEDQYQHRNISCE
jgi:hypothetical protein